ncbi:MAG TPA: (d)CMP kinase [Acidimicrobiales bacterium]
MQVVAIDGPSGSGKSTVAKALAARLGIGHLDTGAMYRSVAFAALRRGIDPSDPVALARMVPDVELDLGDDVVMVDGIDATAAIRGPEVTGVVSMVATVPEVRTEMVQRQRQWIEDHDGGVVEGRDIGSVVCPDADLKVFLTARLDVRAERRHGEDLDRDYERVARQMVERDTTDSNRDASPLTVADGALVVDTSELSVEEIVDRLAALL